MPSYDEYMGQISQARMDVGQRIAGLPQFQTDLSEQVYGAEGALPSLRGQVSDKIKGLYDVDTRAAERYAQPSSEMFIRNPYEREKLMSQQHQAGMGDIQDLQQMIAQRQDVLGDAMTKGLDIYKAGIDAQKFQYQSLMDELNMAMKIDASKRSAAGSGGQKAPLYSALVSAAMENAPQEPGKAGQEVSQAGYNYAWDPNMNTWYATEFGPLAQQQQQMALIQQVPSFDAVLGGQFAKLTYAPASSDQASWQYDESRNQIMTNVVNQIVNDATGADAAKTFQALQDTYQNEFTLEEMQSMKEYIYNSKGEFMIESLNL